MILNIHLTERTGVINMKFWNDFASPDDAQKINEFPDLAKFLLSQLESFIWFHSATPRELLECAGDGCALFQYIHERISPTLAAFRQGKYAVEPMDYHRPFAGILEHRAREQVGPPEEEKVLIFVEPQTGKEASTFRFRWFVSPYRAFHALHFQAPESRKDCHISNDWVHVDPFQVVASWSSKFGAHVPRSINYEPGSIGALNRAKTWLTEMREEESGFSDGSAAAAGNRVLPSRLLKVEVDAGGSPSRMCLVDTEGMPKSVPYAALSYCWGGPQEIQLKTETKSEFEAGLAIGSLPNTLKDAAIVTAHLDISYIWIDALCIIQNDPKDKGKELARMAGIYANATVTIVASRAKSVNEGFLMERLPFKDTASPGFLLPGIEPVDMSQGGDIDLKRLLVFPVADLVGYTSPDPLLPEAEASGIPPNPLTSRAWTFQERALSPRVVDFGLYGTTYFARNPKTGQGIFASDGWKEWDRSDTQDLPSLSLAMREDVSMALDEWQKIVTRYSTLDLSFSSDRLPAISAFAQFFSPAFGSAQSYAAGIWKSTFPFSLLWQVNATEGQTIDGLPDELVTVPSWSWAAVTSTVSYPFRFSEHTLKADQGAEVLDCSVQLKLPDAKFGEVMRGNLKMRGRLRPVRLSLEERVDLGEPFHDMTRSRHKLQHMRLIIGMDQRFAEERGLHRRDYEHEKEWYRDLRLPIKVITDRDHAATKAIIGDCSALFALPIASSPSEEPDRSADEASLTAEAHNPRLRHGLLLMKRSNNEYARVAYFESSRFDVEKTFENTGLNKTELLEWFHEQGAWMDDGVIEEFCIV